MWWNTACFTVSRFRNVTIPRLGFPFSFTFCRNAALMQNNHDIDDVSPNSSFSFNSILMYLIRGIISSSLFFLLFSRIIHAWLCVSVCVCLLRIFLACFSCAKFDNRHWCGLNGEKWRRLTCPCFNANISLYFQRFLFFSFHELKIYECRISKADIASKKD